MAGQLSDKYMSQLDSWIGTGPKIFTLLYQITRDGCNATTFHQKCDNQGPTVTVLYNQQRSVYGGYGSLSWNSSNSYMKDANAFIFQLRYSGNEKTTKFPIKIPEYGLCGNSTYGPTFGGGNDLQAFTGTVNSSGGYFALNGRMNVHSFDYQGLTVDKINNGNLQVTELEYLETLTEDIVSFKPSCELGLSDVRILMLGPVGTGKSSFYNTVNSVFKGRISHNAPCWVASNGITIAYNPYAVKVRSGIPQAVLLTKVDLACQDVASTLSSVFTSKKIEDAVNKVSSMFGLPRNHVLPVKNYENEMELDDNISILALLALRQLLFFSEDYIQVLQDKLKSCIASNEKPHKRESLEKGSDQE
ncbi:interferon-induced protein 44-like [Dreissena polymorpha]|uniref:interferon-induced protein 44-like n=1 Tax=Dreissena polymorpha TaxID=45954 RepID=UPI00226483BE|nr:interferon-induced protein 44-like [Dreissena polymorpha]